MSVIYQDDWATVHVGDCVDVIRSLDGESIDAVVTDPPYGIAFMGQEWDQPGAHGSHRRNGTPGPAHTSTGANGAGAMDAGRYDLSVDAMRAFQAWCEEWATECMRVLKPGGWLVAFGGARTWHRLAAGIEDAGFEVRDSLAWIHSQGFPKSVDVEQAIARMDPVSWRYPEWEGWGTALKPAFEPIVLARRPLDGTVAWTAVTWCTGALHVDACAVGDDVRVNPAAANKPGGAAFNMSADGMPQDAEARERVGRWPTNVLLDEGTAALVDAQPGAPGSVSRYFPVMHYASKAAPSERPQVGGVQHPTVKGLDLMRWLVRLVARPGAMVLDPFAGSGTTLEACIAEGVRCVGVEREDKYVPLILERLGRDIDVPMDIGL